MPRYDIYKTLANTSANIKLLRSFNPFSIHKKGTRAKAIFALAVVSILWGTTWIASKEGVRYMPGLQLAGIRQIIAGVLYVCFFIYRKAPWPKGKEWIPILVLSFLNFIMSNGLSTWGVNFISAGLGSIMAAIFPLWLVVIGLFASKNKLPRNALIGLILGFGGVCIIFSQHLRDFLIPDFRFGIILSLIATWTWAFASLYTKQQATKFNPYFGLGLQMVIAGISLVLITGVTGISIPIQSIPWQAWSAIAYLVLFGSVITFIAYLYALQNLPTEQASIYAYINPIVAVLCGWLIFNEVVTVFIIIGGLVALLGVFMVNKAFKTSISSAELGETEGV